MSPEPWRDCPECQWAGRWQGQPRPDFRDTVPPWAAASSVTLILSRSKFPQGTAWNLTRAQRGGDRLVLFRRRARGGRAPVPSSRDTRPAAQEGSWTHFHTPTPAAALPSGEGPHQKDGNPWLRPLSRLSKDTKPHRALMAPCTIPASVLTHPHPILQKLISQTCSRCMVCVPAFVSVSLPFCLDLS